MAKDKNTGEWLTCEECGCQIRGGGTKYCSKCRKGIKYDSVDGKMSWEEMILEEAKEEFRKDYVHKKLKHNYSKYLNMIFPILFAFSLIMVFIILKFKIESKIIFYIGIIISLVVLFFIFKQEIEKRVYREKALKLIENKDKEYTNFVKKYIKEAKEKISEEAKYESDLFNV